MLTAKKLNPADNNRAVDNPRVSVYLHRNDYRKLVELTRRLNMTQSELIRELIRAEWGAQQRVNGGGGAMG